MGQVLTKEVQIKRIANECKTYEQLMEMILSGVEGAWPNGTKVEKTNSEPGDYHKDGKTGEVKGSLWVGHIEPGPEIKDQYRGVQYMYAVKFDEDDDDIQVYSLMMDKKLKLID